MSLSNIELYSCAVCGNTLAGMEWEDNPDKEGIKDYKCPSCNQGVNEDELIKED